MKTETAKEILYKTFKVKDKIEMMKEQFIGLGAQGEILKAMQAYADQQVKAERMKVRYYKLTLRHGYDNDLSVDYFDDLTKLCVEVYHAGVESMSVVVNCVEVSQEEYNNNYLPI